MHLRSIVKGDPILTISVAIIFVEVADALNRRIDCVQVQTQGVALRSELYIDPPDWTTPL